MGVQPGQREERLERYQRARPAPEPQGHQDAGGDGEGHQPLNDPWGGASEQCHEPGGAELSVSSVGDVGPREVDGSGQPGRQGGPDQGDADSDAEDGHRLHGLGPGGLKHPPDPRASEAAHGSTTRVRLRRRRVSGTTPDLASAAVWMGPCCRLTRTRSTVG